VAMDRKGVGAERSRRNSFGTKSQAIVMPVGPAAIPFA
jgi:hypothetical protein